MQLIVNSYNSGAIPDSELISIHFQDVTIILHLEVTD